MTMFVSSSGAVLNIALNWVFIHLFGYMAAAYTTLFCYGAFALAHYLFVVWVTRKKVQRVIFDAKFMAVESAGFLALSMGMLPLYSRPVIRYGIIGLLCLAAALNRRKIKKLMEPFIQMRKGKK